MNLQHLRYAVEVARTHSISRAAENLYMNQPNLSRAIRELEGSLGISLFDRTPKGISITPDGEEFLTHAEQILRQVEEVEAMYRPDREQKQRFSVWVPRASYISEAFAEFVQKNDHAGQIEIFYKETSADRAIRNILQSDYGLGIIRYLKKHESRFMKALEEKGLQSRPLCEFRCAALMSRSNQLAGRREITEGDLEGFLEIADAEPYVPSMPVAKAREQEYLKGAGGRIFVFERASRLELLERVPDSFMWVSPEPQSVLEKHSLALVPCAGEGRICRDVLIYRRGYRFSPIELRFIDEIILARDKYNLAISDII